MVVLEHVLRIFVYLWKVKVKSKSEKDLVQRLCWCWSVWSMCWGYASGVCATIDEAPWWSPAVTFCPTPAPLVNELNWNAHSMMLLVEIHFQHSDSKRAIDFLMCCKKTDNGRFGPPGLHRSDKNGPVNGYRRFLRRFWDKNIRWGSVRVQL